MASGGNVGRPGRRPASASGVAPGRLRGIVAALGIFLITLIGAGIDSLVGSGLGTLTLVALVAATCAATLLVRRRDLATVLIAPPLVFVGVAVVDVMLAPSASFSLATVATLLVRGFPTMAVATGVGLVLAVVRLVSRR